MVRSSPAAPALGWGRGGGDAVAFREQAAGGIAVFLHGKLDAVGHRDLLALGVLRHEIERADGALASQLFALLDQYAVIVVGGRLDLLGLDRGVETVKQADFPIA